MPITSFDIPEDLLRFLDKLVDEGFARSRRETVLRALQMYIKLQMHRWNGSFIFINGIRKALMSKGSLLELTSEMSDKQLYEAGKRMGKTLRDSATQRNLDISRPENYKDALQILADFGWGSFDIEKKRITITGLLFPPSLMHGYLEAALGTTLEKKASVEEMHFFEIKKPALVEETPSIGSRASRVR